MNVGAKHSLTVVKTKVRLCLDESSFCMEPCHRNRTIPDCFNHRALGISPRSPLWLARVTGYLMPNHRRTALGSPKTKTPQDALWSWLLARATARRLTRIKNLACCRTRPHSTLRGSRFALSPRCHSRRFGLYITFQTTQDATPSIAKSLPEGQFSIGKPPIGGCPKSWQAQSVNLLML